MKALSIQQPWAFLICQGIKDIENRDWSTSYRGFILIHAGQKMDEDFFLDQGLHYPTWNRLPGSVPENASAYKRDYERGGIVGYATLQKVVTSSDSPWFRGKYGFVLTQRRPIPFIPLRGYLGLFDVPAEIEAQINEIREQRFHEEESREMTRIAKEWYDYRHAGDEVPDPRPWKERGNMSMTTILPKDPHVHDRVAIISSDGFNGKQGVLDRIKPSDACPGEYAYWVNFGLKWYGYKVVPFRRDEVRKVVKHA